MQFLVRENPGHYDNLDYDNDNDNDNETTATTALRAFSNGLVWLISEPFLIGIANQ